MTLAGFQSHDFTAGLQTLGLNRDRFYVPASHIGFAYRMQARFDAPLVSTYLQALSDVTNEWTGSGKEDLQILLVSEESKGVHTQRVIDRAFESIPSASSPYYLSFSSRFCTEPSLWYAFRPRQEVPGGHPHARRPAPDP